ncbi:hypothetical protein B795N_00530 [Marinilactibacillus psychrotolerans]|nr:hypothetical protein [Marinilactibacillus psychrotolerans]GEQ32171.1 hypothetical protein B795N_00530 [Marinilactibacillus psychrotolerans]
MPWIPKKSQEPIKKPPRVTNPVVEKKQSKTIMVEMKRSSDPYAERSCN